MCHRQKTICWVHTFFAKELRGIFDFLSAALAQQYEQVTLLKDGPRGRVVLLRHKESGQRCILRHFTGSGEVYRQLLNTKSPHLPQILEIAQKGDQVLVLEEYIQGDNLAWLLEGGPLSPAQAREIALQICQALWVLHRRNAVHRDVKPENIILRGDQAVLIDFDASRVFKPENAGDTQILGTTGYASPEQYGISQTTARADIYSLGVVLNVMLTGKHPALQPAAGHLGRVVQRCTMTNPKKRYRSVIHLMEAL